MLYPSPMQPLTRTGRRLGPAGGALLLRSTVVAALGGLLFGFDTAVISGTTSALTQTFQLSPSALGFTVSSALWGTVLGAILASIPSDRYGRRASLGGLAILYLVSALGCAVAWGYASLIVFRVIGGLAVGASSVIGPMYIAEIAPARTRGRLVAFFQLNIVLGILAAYFSNYMVGLIVNQAWEWRWKFGIEAAPAALFFIAVCTIPRSPRWLARAGRTEDARKVLELIGEPDPDARLQEITESLDAERASRNERLFQPRYRLPIFLALSIGVFNQLSGINAILYYLNDIFEQAGFTKTSSDVQAVIIGFTNLVFTVLAMAVIDRLGRKKLLLIGAAGMAVCLACVATVFVTGAHGHLLLWFLMAFMAFFSFSQGAVIWVYLSEVFPNLVRAKGQSLGSFSHWIMNAMISAVFPLMAAASSAVPFYFFSGMTVLQFVVVLLFYPETKGVTLEQMHKRVAVR